MGNTPVAPAAPVVNAPGTQGAPVAQGASAAPTPAGQQAAAAVVALAQQFALGNNAAKASPLPPLPVLKTPEEVEAAKAAETQNRALAGNAELHGNTGGTQIETGTGKSVPGSEAVVRGELDRKTQAAKWLFFGRKLGSSKDRLGWTVASIDALMRRIKKDPALLERIGGALEVRIGANVFSGPVAQLMLLAMTARPEERSLIRTIVNKTNSNHGKQRARILDVLEKGFVATRDQIGVLQNWLDWEIFHDREQGKRFAAGGLAFAGIGRSGRAASRVRGTAGSARRLRLLQNATTLARRGLGPAAATKAASSLATAQRFTRRLIARRKLALGEAERGSGVLPRPKHTANIIVRGRNGIVRIRTRFVSGNMTAEEKMLGHPQRMLATHTEVRAINATKLKPGETMEITGLERPCTSCRGHMNRAARKHRVRFVYKWRENGRTQVWITDGR